MIQTLKLVPYETMSKTALNSLLLAHLSYNFLMDQALGTSLKPDVFAESLSLFFVGFFHAEKIRRGNLNGKRAILVKPTPPSQKSLFIFSPELGGRSHFLAPARFFFTNVLNFQVFFPFFPKLRDAFCLL